MSLIYVGTSPNNLRPISLDPSAISWGLQDVSSSEAGRVQDANATMYKNRVAQKRKLSLTWAFPNIQQTKEILQAFNPEYFYVRYFDPMAGDWEIRQFYTGDRSSPFQRWNTKTKVYQSLSFDIIER